MKRAIAYLLCLLLMLGSIPGARAQEEIAPYHPDLSPFIENEDSRRYVQMMLDYYLRTDTQVQTVLEEGLSAVFLFEGCSDNMDDSILSDLSYYRVSAVCIALRLDDKGEPYIAYFNDDSSTIPDRPLDYGAWQFEDTGPVGPATIRDGTYELYSVRHGGSYEALHVRSNYEDGTIAAVYMTPEGYVTKRANQINIHTRTGNHIITRGMWSAGCILVGGGDWVEFTQLMEAIYYSAYDTFEIDREVGTITINRQFLRDKMYDLYESNDAVDMLLANSRRTRPEEYLYRCRGRIVRDESTVMKCLENLDVMSLPCTNLEDARSISLASHSRRDKLVITGQIINAQGQTWYETDLNGVTGYIPSKALKELGWFGKLIYNWFH